MIDKKQEVTDFITQHISKRMRIPISEINLNDKISDFGMDSLDFAEMIIEVEDKFRINLSPKNGDFDFLNSSIKKMIDTYFTNKNNSGT